MFDGLGETLLKMLVGAGIHIVAAIYKVAAGIFEIFMVLADGTLLDSIDINKLVSNFYVVIGVVMLFVVAFSMLKGMVNPDDGKQGTSVVKKVIINLVSSAVIMAVLPSIFAFAYDFQESFIYNYNPIGKFFGYGSLQGDNSSTADEIKSGAYKITNGIFTAFFNANIEECGDGMDIKACQENISNGDMDLSTAIKTVDNEGTFGLYADFAQNVVDKQIDFNFLLILIAGLVVCYVAFSFCFDMAIRLVKLVFYQIIAPIPVFLRIIPNGKISGIFGDWMKVTIACYLEVYVRIFIFYFCIYLCNAMIEAPFFANLSDRGFFVGLLSKALVLMGIVMFMKQAPKLIGDMTGFKTGNMKLGIREKLRDGGLFAATDAIGGGLGAGITRGKGAYENVRNKWGETRGKNKLWTGFKRAGLIAGAVGSTVYTAGKGTVDGAKHGWKSADFKSIGSEVKNAQTLNAAEAQGMTFRENATNTVRSKFGFDTTADANLRNIEKQSEVAENRSSYDINGIHFDKNGKVYKGKLYNDQGEEITYSDGTYKDSKGKAYTGKLYDSKKSEIKKFSKGEGLHYDTSGNEYTGVLKTEDGRTLSYADGIYTDENGQKYTGQVFDSKGQKLLHGFKIDANDMEQLEALKAQNVSAIAGFTDQIRALDKQIAFGKSQMEPKSTSKSEAEKKIDEAGSKYRYNFKYYETDVNGNDIEKVFKGTYAEIVEFRNKHLTAEQQMKSKSLEDIRGEMINQAVGAEYAGDTAVKKFMVKGFESLINTGGYTYKYVDPTDGQVKEGKITARKDANGRYIMEENGVDIFTDQYNKFMKDINTDVSFVEGKAKIEADSKLSDAEKQEQIAKLKEDTVTGKAFFKIFSMLDVRAKKSNTILENERQTIDERYIDSFRGQNEAIDNIVKQSKEQKDAKKKSDEQRRKEASKKYMANRGGK